MQCVIAGYQQRHIHEAAWNQLQSIEDGTTKVIGVNTFTEDQTTDIVGQIQNSAIAGLQQEQIEQIIEDRDSTKADQCIRSIEEAITDGSNLMEPLIEAFKAEVTLGEVNDILRDNFGTWIAPSGV
jgi:methylmalonyl-CoA mutase N-terminal domain/subunit